MEYIYGALLLHSAGQPITEENLTKVLKVANVNINEAMVKAVVASLEGVNIEDILRNVPSQIVAQPAQTQPAQAQSAEKKEEKKAEEKEEKATEEDVAAGLSALFG